MTKIVIEHYPAARQHKATNRNPIKPEAAVARIRELRDEWDY